MRGVITREDLADELASLARQRAAAESLLANVNGAEQVVRALLAVAEARAGAEAAPADGT